MTFLDYLDEFWIPKYECKDGMIVVGAVSKITPVAFAVVTDVLYSNNKMYTCGSLNDAEELERSLVSPVPPTLEQDAWAHNMFVAAAIMSDEIVIWLKQAIVFQKTNMDLN